MLGKTRIKWKECPDMTIAVDWDVKHQFKQTNNYRYHSGLSDAGASHTPVDTWFTTTDTHHSGLSDAVPHIPQWIHGSQLQIPQILTIVDYQILCLTYHCGYMVNRVMVHNYRYSP